MSILAVDVEFKLRSDVMTYSKRYDVVILGTGPAGLQAAIASRTVTYDFARLMEGATEVKCSEFADCILREMK